MKTSSKFIFLFSLILLLLVGQQAKAQGFSDKEMDRYERLEYLLSLFPEEFESLYPSIDEVAISRLKIIKNRDAEIYNLIDTALVFSITQNPKRYTYTYDEAGKLTIKLLKQEQNNEWQNVVFESLNYDDFDNVELQTSKVWQGGVWVNDQRINNQYIENNLVELSTVENWDGEWQFQTRDSFNWYLGGNIASHLIEIWDSEEWTNETYAIFIRDENENLLNLIVQNWDGSNWQNVGKTVNTYNVAGLNDSSFVMIWNEGGWENFYLYTNNYNGELITAETGAFYEDEVWVSDIRASYTYNTDGFIDVATSQNWLDNAWQNIERNNFYYNEWGSFETILGESWQSDSWVNKSLKTFIFDESGNALEGVLYTWDNDSWQNTQDDVLIMPYHFGIYEEFFTGYLVEIAYRSILVETPENRSNLNIRIYPNPVSSVLNIDCQSIDESGSLTLTISDQQGKVVLQKALNNFLKRGQSHTLDLSAYKNGLYTLMIKGTNFNTTKKILLIN